MKIAVIGLGNRLGRLWARIVGVANDAQNAALTLVGYADQEPYGKAILTEHGIDAGVGYDDHRRMLRELKPDLVLIGSPNHLHLEHIRDSLASGAQVFTEKPVTISPEDTFTVAELIRDAGPDRLQVGLVLRCSPVFRAISAALPRIGDIVSLEANEHLSPEHGGFIMRDWRRKRALAESHILEKCCHDIDLIQAITGRAKHVASFGGRSVYTPENATLAEGDSGTEHARYQKWGRGWNGVASSFGDDIDVVDHQVVIIETERGVRISFNANCHAPLGERRWLMHGTGGSIDGNYGTSLVRVREAWQQPEDMQIDIEDSVGGGGHNGADNSMGRDLIATWLDGAPLPVPAKAALEAGLTCMAIDQAQRERCVIAVTPWLRQLDSILPA